MTIKEIMVKLQAKPSYLKWGDERLAKVMGATPERIKLIKATLRDTKRNYLAGVRK